MQLQELYRMIELQPEVIDKLDEISKKTELKQFEPYLKDLMEIETAGKAYGALKDFLHEDKDNFRMLYCQLECARRTADRYQEKHIGQDVFIDTMKCFPRFHKECKEKNGRMYFDRGWWTYRQISMKIFRIGELEYELSVRDGENVVGIHIPSDADLSAAAVDASLEQAALFFQTYYQEFKYHKYTCNSWLLSPALRPFLSQDSNILAFQNRFEILRENREDREYIEWLFQVPEDTGFENLPAKTRLQRSIKQFLLNGGTVGAAYGIIRWKRE